ncbi:MAG TPA: hypothetical protein VMD07_06760 [Candidatus Acidoferrales bacterium]|nr:hypothetical protein [Candidatus Acidoferrales bacterium]
MFVRISPQPGEGIISARPVLERERVTLSNVQIDSWLARHSAFRNGESNPPETFEVLRAILARYAWRKPETLEFLERPLGRAYLRADVQGRPLYFVSACSIGVLAIVISREPRMGIELISPSEREALLPRIESEICAQERDLIAGLSPPARQRALLSIWTRKRALQRANAVHEVSPLRSIAVGLGELGLELPASFGWLQNWRLHGFTLRSGEIGSIAVYRHDQLLIVGAGDRRTGGKAVSVDRERRAAPD